MERFLEESILFLNVLMAAVLGFVIGFERKKRYKEAGIRTHALVCAGSALMMVISKYGFWDSDVSDKSRIASQIVSGIGFLGAGIIVYRKQALRGVTTAAGIWMTAGVGMAAGSGMYYIAVLSTSLILLVHLVLALPIKALRLQRFFGIRVTYCDTDGETELIKRLFHVNRFSSVDYTKENTGRTSVVAEIYTKDYIPDEEILTLLNTHECISAIKRIVE